MYKDILIPLANAAVDDLTLLLGIALAREHDAHLTALVSVALSIPIGFEMTTFPPDVYDRLHEVERARGEELAQRARERLRKEDISWEVRSVESPMLPTFDVAVMHARHADLTIVPAAVDRADYASSTFADLLTGSGRPVLVVPPKHEARSTFKQVVVAWQPTREATRAVHDALPILQRAARVDVIVVDPKVDDSHHGEEPGADIATHLARHGVHANVVALPSMGTTTGQAIMRFAGESGADLLVAGGYSHSRLREHVFGGVTRGLFWHSPIPVLFSH